MRYGLLLPHFGANADVSRINRGAQLAEAEGFDSLWVRDHLIFRPHPMEDPNPTFIEPFLVLAFVASATERIKLGTAVAIPFRHPIHLAYTVSSLSWLAARQVEVGMGIGDFAYEFEAIGLDGVDRADLAVEQLEIARSLWQGETVTHQGQTYKFADVALRPTPVDHVPVWWGGASPRSARLAVDHYDGWLAGRTTFRTLEARIGEIRGRAQLAGRSIPLLGAGAMVCIAGSEAAALSRMNVSGLLDNANRQRFWAPPESGHFETATDLAGAIVVGDAPSIAAGFRRFEDLGLDLLIIDLRMVFEEWEDQIVRIAREVIPLV